MSLCDFYPTCDQEIWEQMCVLLTGKHEAPHELSLKSKEGRTALVQYSQKNREPLWGFILYSHVQSLGNLTTHGMFAQLQCCGHFDIGSTTCLHWESQAEILRHNLSNNNVPHILFRIFCHLQCHLAEKVSLTCFDFLVFLTSSTISCHLFVVVLISDSFSQHFEITTFIIISLHILTTQQYLLFICHTNLFSLKPMQEVSISPLYE